jgi:tRNA ligase
VVASTSPSSFKIEISKLLWDEKVMVLAVENVEQVGAKEGNNLMDVLPDATRNRLHITIGTANGTIAAVEGMKLMQKWKGGQKEKDGVFEREIGKETVVAGQLKGLIS